MPTRALGMRQQGREASLGVDRVDSCCGQGLCDEPLNNIKVFGRNCLDVIGPKDLLSEWRTAPWRTQGGLQKAQTLHLVLGAGKMLPSLPIANHSSKVALGPRS